jgi:hypothetical protein
MILIVTNKEDITADYVILKLRLQQIPFLRLNTEDVPLKIDIHIRYVEGHYDLVIQTDAKTYLANSISGIWYRRPGLPVIDPHLADSDYRGYSQSECSEFLRSLYAVLPNNWLNDPFCLHKAECKPYQLMLAQAAGLSVPKTVIGNSPSAAIALMDDLHDQVVAKPIRNAVFTKGEDEYVIFTHRLTRHDRDRLEDLKLTPCILQEFISKQLDIRVTVVGNEIFPVEIHSQSKEETSVDWRRGEHIDLHHARHGISEELRQKCLAITKLAGLRFAAIDLALGNDGVYYFLEMNPNGQWAWIEERVGYDISGSIVRQLLLGDDS